MEGNVINLEPQRTYQGYDKTGNAKGTPETGSSATDTVDVEAISKALGDVTEYLKSELGTIQNKINTIITDHSAAVQISGVNLYNTQLLVDNITNGQKTFESDAENLLNVAVTKYNAIQKQKNKEAMETAANKGGDGGRAQEVG